MNLVKPEGVTTTGTITRSTIGTYFDSAGLMQTAAINENRINYDPYTGEFKGILIENASTNLITRSEEIDLWLGPSGLTVTADSGSSSWTNTFDGLTPSATAGNHFVGRQVSTMTAGAEYTTSMYVKKGSSDYIELDVTGSTSPTTNISRVVFQFSTLTATDISIGTGVVTDKGIERVSSDIWRVWMKGYPDTTSVTRSHRIYLCSNTGSNFFTGDGVTVSAYVWGVQVELGNLSSYIKTTTATVTRAADVISGSGLVYTNVTNAYAEWSSATTYSLGTSVSYGAYGTYISLQNSNLNQNPLTANTFWSRTGPTNKMAAFDDVISTTTTSTSDIIFAITASSIDTVALLNLTGTKSSIAVSDASSKTELYHNSQQLTGQASLDWYSYFFYDSDTVRTMSVYLDIPILSNALISIKISGTGTVGLGTLVQGVLKRLGDTQYGVSAGIIDYSRKEADEFGNISFVERNYSKRINASVSLTNANLNKVQRLLYELRATPVLWLASTDIQFEEPLITYGFYRDFSTEISYPTHSICNLQIEGLI